MIVASKQLIFTDGQSADVDTFSNFFGNFPVIEAIPSY